MSFAPGHAYIVGIANYSDVRKLPDSVLNDARDIANTLSDGQSCGYPADHVRLTLDADATAESIRANLKCLATRSEPDSTAFFYFSGHGGRVHDGASYLIPYDCDPHNIQNTAISGEELTDLLRGIKAGRLVCVFDCCYAGGTGEPKDLGEIELKEGLNEAYYERLAQGSGRVIIASSRIDEVSLVMPGRRNSLFTECFLEAIKGGARTRADGLIRIFDIFDYVSEEVPSRGNQHPVFKASDLEQNFPLALYLGGKKMPTGSQPTRARPSKVNRRDLREALIQHFSLNEFELLCSDLQQDMENDGIELLVRSDLFGGDGLAIKAHRLIEFLGNRGYLAYLVSAIRRERSGII